MAIDPDKKAALLSVIKQALGSFDAGELDQIIAAASERKAALQKASMSTAMESELAPEADIQKLFKDYQRILTTVGINNLVAAAKDFCQSWTVTAAQWTFNAGQSHVVPATTTKHASDGLPGGELWIINQRYVVPNPMYVIKNGGTLLHSVQMGGGPFPPVMEFERRGQDFALDTPTEITRDGRIHKKGKFVCQAG